MRRRLAAAVAVVLLTAGSASAQGGRSRSESIRALFGMEEPDFDRELARRFHYPPPQPLPDVVEDRAAGQAADAAYLQSFPNFDRSYAPPARAQAKRLAARLAAEASSLSHEQFVLRVAEIAALADNAHTSVGENAWRKGTPRLPIRTFLFADGLHVLYADPANADLLGARIDTIAGQPIDSIYRRLARYVGGPEPRRRLRLIPVLESPALLRAAGVLTSDTRLALGGVLADGRSFERTVEAEQRDRSAWVSNTIRLLFPGLSPPNRPLQGFLAAGAELPVYLRRSNRLFTMDELPGRGIYVGITHNGDGDEEKSGPFLASALSRVRSGKPGYVVLDMRMNGGGDYTTTYDFARSLPRAAAGAPIYVLTSPWTFSAAITTVAALKDAGGDQVRIVGTPVGDRLDFWAEGGTFDLPNSGMQVHYAAARHNYGGPCTDRQACFWLNELYPVRVDNLEPDVSAPLTFEAYRERRDPAMDAVLALQSRRGERG